MRTLAKLMLLSILFSPLSIKTSYANAVEEVFDKILDPENFYIALDGQLNTIIFKQGYGNNAFNSLNPQLKFTAGIAFTDSLSLELGYAQTDVQNKTITVNEAEEFLGETVLFPSEEHTLSFWLQSIDLTLVYSKKIYDEKLKLSAGLGAHFLLPEINHTRNSITLIPGSPTISYTNFDFETKNYVVPQLLLRVGYEIFNDIFITASYSLEVYPIMPQIRDEVIGDAYDYRVDFRLGNTIGLGVMFYF